MYPGGIYPVIGYRVKYIYAIKSDNTNVICCLSIYLSKPSQELFDFKNCLTGP